MYDSFVFLQVVVVCLPGYVSSTGGAGGDDNDEDDDGWGVWRTMIILISQEIEREREMWDLKGVLCGSKNNKREAIYVWVLINKQRYQFLHKWVFVNSVGLLANFIATNPKSLWGW